MSAKAVFLNLVDGDPTPDIRARFDMVVLAAIHDLQPIRSAALDDEVFGRARVGLEVNPERRWTGPVFRAKPTKSYAHHEDLIPQYSRMRMLDAAVQRLRKAGQIESVHQRWRVV